MSHQIKVLTVEGSKMEVFVFEPEGEGPFPGLVQCMHIPVGHTGIENDEFTVGPATVLGNLTLYQVESIQADKHYQTLLVAEEMKEHHKIMALDLMTGEVIKEDLGNFDRGNDPEGIALVIDKDNNGYWICTEQSKTDNRFHLYDRKTLEYMTTMYLDNVSYTDGIATAYMHGKWFLYAVDNDARVVAFELPEIN